MSDVPRQLPPKKEVALTLLEGPSLFVHLDPRRTGVLVPKWFTGQSQLVLQVGLNMAIPIPDLKLDEVGISCTLSFNRSPFWCRLPWSSIYALVGEDGRGMVWPDDVPPEVAQQMQRQQPQAGKAAPGKRPRAKLAAVGPSDDEPAPRRRGREFSGTELRAAESNAGEAPPASAQGPTPSEGEAMAPSGHAPEPRRIDALSARSRPHSAPAARSEDEVNKPPASPAVADSPAGRPGPSSVPSGSKKPKRELPPYLRVIK